MARIDNNKVQTPVIAGESFISVATVTDPADCDPAVASYAESQAAIFLDAPLDYSGDVLNAPVLQSSDSGIWVCVANLSAGTVLPGLTYGFENVASLEVGDCTPGEVAAGDTTCLDADPGELGGQLMVSMGFAGGTWSRCTVGDAGQLQDASYFVPTDFLPGEYCAINVQVFDLNAWVLGQAPDPIYSTDDVSFDLVFYADDGTP